MTDLLLIGIFIFCMLLGYIMVKKSGGFLEYMLFHNSEMWYNRQEKRNPFRLRKEKRQRRETEKPLAKRVGRDSLERAKAFPMKSCETKNRGARIKHEWKTN